ncbi:putative glycosyltransferase [Panicum miliaceum]|uniref:Glycosyltransferase n=1 Tax=Panicum miliaceum TaxID=4540 RepID=A0A3L6RZT0_PANMI|nr:putative glycosyltransferase [Panicum miliaceum]
MGPPPEASLRATLSILTVVLSTVLAGNSVDVVSSSNELLTSSSPSPASPWPTPSQLPPASADLTTKRNGGDTRTPLSVERELDAARAVIRRAARRRDLGHGDGNVSTADSWFDAGVESSLLSSVYRNPAAFHRSYREMEKRFKVYVYEEGEPPILHAGPCKDIYSIEGRFIEQLELMAPAPPQGDRRRGVRTSDPARAHAFFLPFSVSQMVRFAYRPNTYDKTPLLALVGDYIRVVASRHPYWNRSAGADHFMLSCHDWGPEASMGHPELQANGIRALCNANTSEGFRPGKDVSVPEINLYDGDMPRQLLEPAPGLASRPFLAFFAGGRHGHVRDALLRHWKGRDPDVFPVFEHGKHQQGLGYYSFMRRARFCLCPSGYEVASPRVVEAVHAECVPVVVSDGYALPFADVLRWEAFSVAVPVADIPRLREVLERIPAAEVERLRQGVRLVKRHFMLHQPPERLDVFHMILHSVWLRRLNLRLDH